jgi:hypothetical protein
VLCRIYGRFEGVCSAVANSVANNCATSCTSGEQARARAAEHGFGLAELLALPQRRAVDVADTDLAILAVRLSGASGLTGMHNTFARRHALAEIAGGVLARCDDSAARERHQYVSR